MAIDVQDQHGYVVRPPIRKYTKDGRSYAELVVDFGDKKQDHWYVKVWKEALVSMVMRLAVKDAKVVVSGSISKWQVTAKSYGVAINAEDFKMNPAGRLPRR